MKLRFTILISLFAHALFGAWLAFDELQVWRAQPVVTFSVLSRASLNTQVSAGKKKQMAADREEGSDRARHDKIAAARASVRLGLSELDHGDDRPTGAMSAADRYLSSLRARVYSHRRYPEASRALREEGTVQVRITLARSGSILRIEVLSPSPHKRLNVSAVQAVADASPFGEFPAEVSFETWQIVVPIRYSLSQTTASLWGTH